jgi:hypothetical protein
LRAALASALAGRDAHDERAGAARDEERSAARVAARAGAPSRAEQLAAADELALAAAAAAAALAKARREVGVRARSVRRAHPTLRRCSRSILNVRLLLELVERELVRDGPARVVGAARRRGRRGRAHRVLRRARRRLANAFPRRRGGAEALGVTAARAVGVKGARCRRLGRAERRGRRVGRDAERRVRVALQHARTKRRGGSSNGGFVLTERSVRKPKKERAEKRKIRNLAELRAARAAAARAASHASPSR